MDASKVRVALVLGAVLGLAACESPTAPEPPTPKITSLTISGTTSIGDLGETTQLTATARSSDGAAQDVTAQAQWSSDGDPLTRVVSVISPGLIRAERYGKGGVHATYGSASAQAEVRVGPDGAFLVTVDVSDHGFATDGARVQATSSAGTFSATTNLWGFVSLPAVGETTLQVEKAGFRTIAASVTVSSDQDFDFVLQPSDEASSTTTR